MKKYTNDELLRMDAVEVYKLRLDRKIHRFPNGFWQLSEGKENAKKCVRYLLEEVLEYQIRLMNYYLKTNQLDKRAALYAEHKALIKELEELNTLAE